MADEIDDITDDEEQTLELYSRRDILAPAIRHVIAALGGYEETPSSSFGPTYVLGDECYGCLKDLKRFWRKDDTDDERTVARIFYESAVLSKDLIPIVLETAGKGDVSHRCAIAAVDLMTGMTWPIDIAAELRELDEQDGERDGDAAEYTTLIMAQLQYKRALVKDREILAAIFDLVVPCMAKERWNRSERDKQIVTLILYLLRNLAFIRDLPLNTNLSADQAELSSLQSRYIGILHDTLVLDFLLTFASNAIDDPLANAQNTLILEIFYLLFRSIPPTSILPSSNGHPHQAITTNNALRNALDSEFRNSRLQKRHLTSRHSRFGTTIKVSSSRTGQSLVLHRGAAAVQGKGTGEVLDRGKKKLAKRGMMRDELTGGAASAGGGTAGSGGETKLSLEARENLGKVAKVFVESCFNPFLSSIIKDIRAERSKVTEKDNLRLLFVTKFFIQFFLAMRERDIGVNTEKAHGTGDSNGVAVGVDGKGNTDEEKMTLSYSLVLEVVQRGWAGWILRRMREAMEMKPKQWTEIQAGLGCLTQLLLLVDAMSTSTDEDLQDAAGTLQYQIYYNGEALERMLECMRSYKDQSFGYLEENIHLAYVLLRMLERWGKKNGGLYIRKTKKRKGPSKSARVPEGEGVVDDVSEDDIGMNDEILQEMTLEKFEHKFANEEVAATLMAYLSKFQEFDSPERMKWLVSLMHRQAVRAKAEGLYFKVSTLAQFQSVLSVQKMLPKDQPYKDLVRLLNFLLRQFFKAVEAEPLVIADALFPKNRGLWKQFSSWEPPEKGKKSQGNIEDSEDEQQDGRFPPDIRVKRGHSWSEQLGIAIACLCEKDERHLVEWTKELLRLIIGVKQLTIDEVDKPQEVEADSDDDGGVTKRPNDNPSMAALAKMEDFIIPYTEDGRAEVATKNPHLKLLFTLIGFEVVDKAATEFEWVCPATKAPADLQRSLNLINNFLLDPLDLNGKKALQMISKQSKRKPQAKTKAKRSAPTERGFLDDNLLDDEDEERDGELRKRGSKRAEKKKREKVKAISAQFIEDSDAEIGDDEEFFRKEKELRERMEKAAASGVVAQGAGTKKRRKNDEDDHEGDKARKRRKSEVKKKKAKQSSEEEDDNGSSEDEQRPTISQLESTPALSDDEEPLVSEPKPNGSTAGSPPPPSSRAPSSRFDDSDEELVSRPSLTNGKRVSTASSVALFLSESEMEEDEDLPTLTQGQRAVRQRQRLVISDEEDE